MGQAPGAYPKDSGFFARDLDLGTEELEASSQRVYGGIDLPAGNGPGSKLSCHCQPGCIAHSRDNTAGFGFPVDRSDGSLGALLCDNTHGKVPPLPMFLEKELKGKSLNVNAGQPDHDKPPCASIQGPSACL